jgi:hypothetical protein
VFEQAKIGKITGWNVRVNTTFIKKVYAKKARRPPNRVTIKGKNFVDKDKK